MSSDQMIVMAGTEQTSAYRVLSMRSALRLECRGLKMSRGRSVYAVVKQEFGFKGSKQKVLDQLSAWIDKNLIPDSK